MLDGNFLFNELIRSVIFDLCELWVVDKNLKTSFWQDSENDNVLIFFFSLYKLKSKRDGVTLEKYRQHLLEF